MRMSDLKSGWAVVGNDGRQLGTIKEVGQNYVLTSRSGRDDLYVPASAIANVHEATVHLNLAKHEAEGMGWELAPREADTLAQAPEGDLHRHV
jgi:hypothetical protein